MKKAALSCFFLSPSVVSVAMPAFTLPELTLSELAFLEIALPEPCFLAQVDHLAAPFATYHLLFRPYRFTSECTAFLYFPCTYVHYQQGTYCQYQQSSRFHSFALHFNGFNTLFCS